MLDSKLAAPNPDYLSYTLSKQALAGFTQLAARPLRRSAFGERDCPGIDAAILRSRATIVSSRCMPAIHCGEGLTEDVVATLSYLARAKTVSGQVLVIDGGQRFDPPGRDVQFLET